MDEMYSRLKDNILYIKERISSTRDDQINPSLINNILSISDKVTDALNVSEEYYCNTPDEDTAILEVTKNLLLKTHDLRDSIDSYLNSSIDDKNDTFAILVNTLNKIETYVDNLIKMNSYDKDFIPLKTNFTSTDKALSNKKKGRLISPTENLAFNNAKEFNLHYKELEKKIDVLNQLATKSITEIDTNFKSKIKSLKEKSDDLEGSLVKKALSGSFKTRATDLEKESKWWLFATACFILCFILLASLNFYEFFKIEDLDFNSLNLHIRASLFYAPISISLFWAIWFCTKKYTHLCHLRDEYNYKHDLSESFIGYKEEVTSLDTLSDSDQKLFPILLTAIIQNICKSPLEPNNQECNSPWSEIVSLVFTKGKEKIQKDSKII